MIPLKTVSQQEQIQRSLFTGWLYLSHSRKIMPNWKSGMAIGMAAANNDANSTGT